ncbi:MULTISPECIES: hydrogenase maturation nickel metallochaperone HypA [Sphingobacterium]|uniref:hydrogenase maturation nickel metallochaperone HypA/HybF n=1 Tax=Sphingobacterium TaxID=28453 RepID=UPI001439868D|nr:hydrogenase maturation nickel metallochaperone HypA [Sphingobacterium sp. B16(2022)]NJI74882.1 hydrogenase maturation nickel metallochaperone HypA [Sphingobacterium sp. B16(2022)]
MHELSIVRDIFSTLEEAYPGRMQDIIKVEIEAGLLCNIQPILIQNAFEAYVLDEALFQDLELEVRLLPIIAYCKVCAMNFEVHYHRFVCTCGQPSDQIIQGEELRISKVLFNNKTGH